MNAHPFDVLPLPTIFVLFTGLMLVAMELGFRIGRRVGAKLGSDAFSSVAPMVGGVLGMLGFVLALSFSFAAAQHETRRQNVVDEANAIGTTYLRADLLGEPYRTEIRGLVRKYVDVRLAASHGRDLAAVMADSAALQQRIWQRVAAAAVAGPTTNTAAMIQTTNELIDMHATRVTGSLYSRIPGRVWSVMTGIALLSMLTLGIQLGMSGNRHLVAVLPMSLAFALLVSLVADLNRPMDGFIAVGQQAMEELKASIDADQP